MKLKKKNVDGKIITKDVPDSLVANYLQIGWEKFIENKIKFEKKEVSTNLKKEVFNDNIKRND